MYNILLQRAAPLLARLSGALSKSGPKAGPWGSTSAPSFGAGVTSFKQPGNAPPGFTFDAPAQETPSRDRPEPPVWGQNDAPMNDSAKQLAANGQPRLSPNKYVDQNFDIGPMRTWPGPNMWYGLNQGAAPTEVSAAAGGVPLPQSRPASAPQDIPGFNPNVPNMADPAMLDPQGLRARQVPDGNGGMMNDFYSKSLFPSFFNPFRR